MGVAWYISTEKEVSGLDTLVDGKSIAHASEKGMGAILRSLNVKPLMEFFSTSPEELAGLLGDYEIDAADMSTMPAEEWFSAEDGLATVRPLFDHLRENERKLEGQEHIIRDLEQYERILAVLAAEGVGWHLSIDI